MHTRTVEQVESWNTRSFADGFAGLCELSDEEFSGAVQTGGAWLFMLNGRIIGVYEGSLDDFRGADGTAYTAPHPSLPLLFSMQEKGGDTRAKYYTNDKPLSEVDATLSEGNFTGYVELSENVLSGDYYVAYYGGRSMSVAFVGSSEQVVTGDEAFERAADEVGIYEVHDVEIEVTDVPEPEGESGSGAPGDEPAGGAASEEPEQTPDPSPASDSGTGKSPAGESTAGHSSRDDGAERTGASSPPEAKAGERPGQADEPRPSSTQPEQAEAASEAVEHPEAESDAADAGTTTDAGADAEAGSKAPQSASADAASPEADAASSKPEGGATSTGTADRPGSADGESDTASSDEDDAFSDEKEWQEAKTIPSLDPDLSSGADESKSRRRASSKGTSSSATASRATGSTGKKKRPATTGSKTTGASQSSDGRPAQGQSSGEASSASGAASASGSATGTTADAAGSSSDASDGEARQQIRELRSQLEQRKQQVQQLKERLSKVESERDEYERERNALSREVKRLESRIESLESSGAGADRREIDRMQAFDGTNLFVRYESKGKATLEEAASGDADHEDVNENLLLDYHTQFEASDVAVAGRPFEEFLSDSFEYRFVTWIVEDLLYEIRDTGHQARLRDLYEAIPKIDRVDLHGSVSAGRDEEDTRTETFDVVMRDRMGNPLIVADLNASRDPTTGEMMGTLVDAASGVGEAHEELSGAFQVTESFFEPEALETAETATTSGFLSREKRESFVKLSRKRGYHLCLVESRSGGFHLNVPEL